MTPKILVLDDDPEMLSLINLYLKGGRFQVLLSGDPHDAFSVIQKEKPELVICDLTMQGIDGCTFHHEVRQMKDMPFTAFLFIPSVDNDMVDHMNYEIGADECLELPIDKNHLLERVEHIIREATAIRQHVIRTH
ncbi:response regulator [bacterium]|nr:response regulator [bacterium]